MMAYNFPDNPTIDQRFQDYTWDGEKWILTVGGKPKARPPAPGDGYARAVPPLRALSTGTSIIAEFVTGKNVFV